MKAVMLSIQPKWCDLIASGKKTVEIRKTRPSIETPFKCYIYETKGLCDTPTFIDEDGHISYRGRGAVIGEFVCDRITCCQAYYGNSGEKHLTNLFGINVAETCLTEYEIFDYIIGKNKKDGTGWLWHISDLVIYDTPKELGEFFRKANCAYVNTEYCRICRDNCKYYKGEFYHSITLPPQSWFYIEEL